MVSTVVSAAAFEELKRQIGSQRHFMQLSAILWSLTQLRGKSLKILVRIVFTISMSLFNI